MITIDILLQVVALGILIDWFLFVVMMGFSCGGCEHCGKRFCPVGLFQDFPLTIMVAIPLALAGIASVVI